MLYSSTHIATVGIKGLNSSVVSYRIVYDGYHGNVVYLDQVPGVGAEHGDRVTLV